MECSKPGTIRDEELFAYLAGEKVRPAVEQHLASCDACSSRLAMYRSMELKLINKLYRWDCPSNQVLGEYQLGMLSGNLAASVQNHLNRCVLCAAEVVSLEQFLANDLMLAETAPASQATVSVRPSQHTTNNHSVPSAKRTLDELLERSHTGVRRIIATLVPPQPRLAFQRDAMQQTSTWPRRYTVEDMSISIQVGRDAKQRDALQLIGLITRKGASLESLQGIPVQLLSQTKVVSVQNVDDLGNFVFSSIVPATYVLELQFPEGTVVIDELTLTSQD